MDYEKACLILGIEPKFTRDMLKRAYYRQALHWHPDKNKHPDATKQFVRIGEAYSFLESRNKWSDTKPESDYVTIVKRCVKYFMPEAEWDDLFFDTTIRGIVNNCEKLSLQLFERMGKDKAIEVFDVLSKHQAIFGIPEGVILGMKAILKTKVRDDNIIVLNPSIDDLLMDKIYKLELNGKDFYVPLWHHEVVFDMSGNDIIVKCVPELDSCMHVDNRNNIYCKFIGSITDVLKDGKAQIKLGSRTFSIDADKLSIKEDQTYTLRGQGMLLVDNDHLYSTKFRGNIIASIKLL